MWSSMQQCSGSHRAKKKTRGVVVQEQVKRWHYVSHFHLLHKGTLSGSPDAKVAWTLQNIVQKAAASCRAARLGDLLLRAELSLCEICLMTSFIYSICVLLFLFFSEQY